MNATIPITKTTTPRVNPLFWAAGEKQRYKLEARRLLVRSAVITLIVWLVLAGLGFVSYGSIEIFSFMLCFPALFVGVAFYLISKLRLYTKYKIPNVGCRYSSSVSNNAGECYSSISDAWHDNNPTFPGTAASHARKMRE